MRSIRHVEEEQNSVALQCDRNLGQSFRTADKPLCRVFLGIADLNFLENRMPKNVPMQCLAMLAYADGQTGLAACVSIAVLTRSLGVKATAVASAL